MSVTPQGAVRSAEKDIRGGRPQEDTVRDYLAAVAHVRPAYDSPGTPSEELEVFRLAQRAQQRHPEIEFSKLELEARDTLLWWRWPLEKQVAAWLKGKWPFDGKMK